jgi:hypothetical protein
MKMVEPSKFEKIWERRPRRRWSCPDEETISAYIDRTLDDNRSKRVVSHLVDCTYCRELVATTVKLQRVEDLPEVPAGLMRRALAAGETQSRRWVWRWAPVSSAAAALVCAGLIVAVWRAPQELVIHKRPAPTAPAIMKFEGPKAGEAPQSGRERKPSSYETEPTMITPQQGQLVSRSHLKFRWNAVPNAAYYQVRLVTAEGDLVWEGSSGTRELGVPDSLVLNGGKYFVLVSAAMNNGRMHKASPVEFQVANPQ